MVKKINSKPFFYKIIAAELMSEVLQIPDGRHREWINQFVIDLVSAVGTTEYSKRLISEVQEFREKQAQNGSKGGKRKKKAPLSDTQAPLSDTQAFSSQPLGSSISNNILTTPTQEKETITGDRTMVDSNGDEFNIDTGEIIHRYSGMDSVDKCPF